MRPQRNAWILTLACFFSLGSISTAQQGLEATLKQASPAMLAAQAKLKGDPKTGALIFFKSAAACVKCHSVGSDASPLGPNLAKLGKEATDEYIIESMLSPSKTIRKGFETLTVITVDGQVKTGLKSSESPDKLVLRDAQNLEKEITLAKDDIDEIVVSKKSMMPAGLIDSLSSEREFFHLVRYVTEVARGGLPRAKQLQPKPEDLVVKDDSKDLDHAGIIRSLGDKDFKAGKEIYFGHCTNCHGPDGNTPKLPTARAFGTQSLKYGGDPYRMFLTLTRGAGLMTPMQHLSPKERYQVVHYIRQAFMKPSNPEFQAVDVDYLEKLPKGTLKGDVIVSADRDYGPVLGSQLGREVNNALTFRLANDVAVCYDLHRMRTAKAWTGGFLDLSQTHHYRQRGERMPQVDGTELPGLNDWQWAFDGSFEIPATAKPSRGPVRSDWLQYYGHYLYDNQAVLSYGIHGRKILETIRSEPGEITTLTHTLRVAASKQPLKLTVARLEDGSSALVPFEGATPRSNPKLVTESIAVATAEAKRTSKRMANQPRHIVTGAKARQLDLGTPGRTVLVSFRTKKSGTLVASTPAEGEWKPNGKSLFVRGGRLVFDIGWVGAMTSKSDIADGKSHVAALVVDEKRTMLYIDGKLEASRQGFRRAPVADHVLKIGATATDFGGDFDGEIEWIQIQDAILSESQISAAVKSQKRPEQEALFSWKPASNQGSETPQQEDRLYVAAAVSGDTDELTWEFDDKGRIVLNIPASTNAQVIRVARCSSAETSSETLVQHLTSLNQQKIVDPSTLTRGGPARWPQELVVEGELGESVNGYALDTIPVPFENPWNAWLRTSALDFFDDGRAVVTTHGGDVYIVSGTDASLNRVVWKRFAAGLFEPFGVRVLDNTIYVTCRDGLKRLHDYDGNGEADFVEAFWIDDDVSSMFHAYNFDLQTDSQGNFYFAKAGQYTQHHRPGTIMRIPPEGGTAEIVAWGLRTPNGMGKLKGDQFTVSDNQGPWMPAGKISLIEKDSFLGNMPINEEQKRWLMAKYEGKLPTTFDEPFIWMPQELDNSSGGQVWVEDKRFGPLSGRLIHSSFGKGWLYYLSLQEIDGKTQGSIVALPHQWKAGVMRLRVNPHDGQLYGTGLSGWQGPSGGLDGCFQRLRYTGKPARLIESVEVTTDGIQLEFNFEVDPETVQHTDSWDGEMWDYLWSRRYGSDQFSVLNPDEKGRDPLSVKNITIVDKNTVRLTIPDLKPCDQVSLKMNFKDSQQNLFVEHVYLTIHNMPAED